VQGKLLQKNSLAPMSGSEVVVEYIDGTRTAKISTQPDGKGDYSLDLPKEAKGWITVSGGRGSKDISLQDSIRLEIP
jgi:hypothetical protein